MIKRIFKSVLFVILVVPGLAHPMWISSVGGPLNPFYANSIITQICNAAKAGDADTVQSLMKGLSTRELEELDPCSGVTVLINAARSGHLEIVRMLLDAGVNPNGPDRGGWTPLRWNVRNGTPEVFQLLIDRGADVNYREDQTTLLMLAAHFTNPPVCKIIVDALLQPVKEEKNRFYTFLNCLTQQTPGFVLSLRRDLFKPLLQEMIREPREKVLQEIDKISDSSFEQKLIKELLLEKYGLRPISNSEAQ